MNELKNIKIKHTTKDAIPNTKIFNELDPLLKKKNINFFFNFAPNQLKNMGYDMYLKKQSKEQSVFHILHKSKLTKKRFHSIIFNSMSIPFSSNKKKLCENRFNYLQKYFKYKENYIINKDGFIVIYCNNPNGYYKEWINYETQIPKLIKQIRKINKKNKIVIRFHRKHEIKIIQNLIKKLKLIDNTIEIDESEFKDTIKQSYCIFIQNASIIIDYINEGIPLFNPKFIPFNDYDGCYNNFNYLQDLKKDEKYLIDRKKFLMESYNYIIFDEEYRDNINYVKNIYLNNIL